MLKKFVYFLNTSIFFVFTSSTHAGAESNWVTRWTNPDGSRSDATPAIFYGAENTDALFWNCRGGDFKWMVWEWNFIKKQLLMQWIRKGQTVSEESNAQIKKFSPGKVKVQTDDSTPWDFKYDPRHISTFYKGKTYDSYGTCNLENGVGEIVGHYAGNRRNRFIGRYIDLGSTFEGYWVQDDSGEECSRNIDCSRFYGRVWFTLEGMNKFSGKWGYCDDTPKLNWSGKRLNPKPEILNPSLDTAERTRKNVQLALNYFGFSAGKPDGIFGNKTRTAVMALQACWAFADPDNTLVPKTKQLGMLTKQQTRFLLQNYEKSKSYSPNANCLMYFLALKNN